MIIEVVTVTRWRAANRPSGWRTRGLRAQRRLAYRDAAWAKMHERCGCTYSDWSDPAMCRYHDKTYRAEDWPGGYDEPSWRGFMAPEVWRLPRSDEQGLWDYGRAVAFRLARFYAHLDARTASAHPASAPPVATVPPGDEAHAKSAAVAAVPAAHGEPEGGER